MIYVLLLFLNIIAMIGVYYWGKYHGKEAGFREASTLWGGVWWRGADGSHVKRKGQAL